MNTFLPYPSFIRSVECLDVKRLSKQRVEVLQILRALRGRSKGWRNHPAVKMWRGHESALRLYGLFACLMWIKLGFKDRVMSKLLRFQLPPPVMPAWFGNPKFHSAHRAALLFKDKKHYRRFGWSEYPATPDKKGRLPYWWPVRQ